MEVDSVLHKVQIVLKTQENIVGNLSEIKSVDEEIIGNIVTALTIVLNTNNRHSANNIDADFNKKLYTFLFLNTDTIVYNELKRNRKFAHVVGFFPKLSGDLFMYIVNSIELQPFLYESVKSFSPAISYQVVKLCLQALKWLDIFKAISFIENLLPPLFERLVTTDDSHKYNPFLKQSFHKLLLHLDANKSGFTNRVRLWDRAKLQHYAGLVMASILSVLQKCTSVYLKSNDCLENSTWYGMDVDEVSIVTSDKINDKVISVQQCYEYILGMCHENVTAITVQIWCFWVEIELDELPDTCNTLQRLVAEEAYKCLETLKESEHKGVSSKWTPDLISKLEHLARKPQTDCDSANLLSLPEILANIEDIDKDSKKWLKFLISKHNFVTEPSSLEIIFKHITSVANEDMEKLFSDIMVFIQANKEDCEVQKTFLLNMVQYIQMESYLKFSQCFIQNFGLSDELQSDTFQSEFIETFNKLVDELDKNNELLYPQFLKLAIQSPKAVIYKCVREGIIKVVTGHIMSDLLRQLRAFCDIPTSEGSTLLMDALISILMNLTYLSERQQYHFPLFVQELVLTKILIADHFVGGQLMVIISQQLELKNYDLVSHCIEIISALFEVNAVQANAAIIVMFLQVLESCRWEPNSYCTVQVQLCERVLIFLESQSHKLIEFTASETYMKQLNNFIQQLISPLNRYHMFRVMNEKPPVNEPGLLLIYRMHYGIGQWSVLKMTSEERKRLTYDLCFILPVLTNREWLNMFCVLTPTTKEFFSLFQIFIDSLLLCLDSSKIRANKNVIECLAFAILNLVDTSQFEIKQWTDESHNELRIRVYSKLCMLISAVPSSEQLEIGLHMASSLLVLMPTNLTHGQINELTSCLALLPHELRSVVLPDYCVHSQ